ncbi:unnamed protein product [Closterium sp. NIES-65]|nr:unnamed protein product [Closterium sp. NIES-65]
MFAKFRQQQQQQQQQQGGDSSPWESEEPEPTELNPSKCGQRLLLSKDKLSVTYTGNGTHNNDVGAIQANRAAPSQRAIYYFEIVVKDRGTRGCVAVGFADASFKTCRQPGWEASSYGYHGDNGKVYHNSGRGEAYGPEFTTNDVVGAGINYGTHEIFFTKNGKSLGPAFRDVKGELFPTIGLHSPNERVEVNFGQKPFLFDVQGMVMDERTKVQRSIDRIPLSPHITHSIVRSYLLFHGYADTLAALDAASNPTPATTPDAAAAAAAAGACGVANGAVEPASLLRPSATAAAGGGDGVGGGGAEGSVRGRETASGPEPMEVAPTGMDAAAAAAAAGAADGGAAGAKAPGNTLSTQGAEAAAAAAAGRARAPSVGSPSWDTVLSGTLAFRAQVRQLIRAGHMDAALNKLFEVLPQLLQNDSAGVTFLLRTTKFAEIVRSGSLEAALAYARSELSGFRGRSPDQDALLEDFLALLAYPDATTSPLAYLLHPSHRDAVADQVNTAILSAAAASSTHSLPSPPSLLSPSGPLDMSASGADAAAGAAAGGATGASGAAGSAGEGAVDKVALDSRDYALAMSDRAGSSSNASGSLAGAVGRIPGQACGERGEVVDGTGVTGLLRCQQDGRASCSACSACWVEGRMEGCGEREEVVEVLERKGWGGERSSRKGVEGGKGDTTGGREEEERVEERG